MGAGQTFLGSQSNSRRDDARGGAFLLAHQQLGILSLGTTPTNGQVVPIVINGTTITVTAVTGTPTNPNDVKAPGTAAGFVNNLVNFLRRPDLSNANQVAASGANQSLLQFVGWAYPGATTSVVPFSLNKNANGITGALTSFNITGITVTSGTWTAQTMQLYVEDGTYYINGTRYLYTGGSTPTVTAPVSNPRIDVLTIDTSGTLAWTTGAEAGSPSAPTYPSNKLPICELYNVVSETALYDTENQQASQGYILNDVRPTASYGPIFSAIAESLVPSPTDTYSLGSSPSAEWLNVYAGNIYASTTMQVGGVNIGLARFGGTGADGALSITSGTTTINLGSANVFTKNYTSISITGTGALAFSTPSTTGSNIILKSQGAVTLTSSATAVIDIGSIGTAGGSAGAGVGSPTNATGSSANAGSSMVAQGATQTPASPTGTAGGSASAAFGTLNWLAASTAPLAISTSGNGITLNGIPFAIALTIRGKSINICPSTGGSGSGGNNQSGSPQNGNAGGAGAGALYIECGGAWNFTGTINANGVNGGTATSRSGNGGPGAGGIVIVCYNLLTANSGTINTAGGTNSGAGPNAGNGASLVVKNDEFS